MDFVDVLAEIISIEARLSGPERAAELERRAASMGRGEAGRAEYLVNAANSHSGCGQHEQAERCCREALADGGPTVIDARVWLVGVLLAAGRVEEAEVMSHELAASNLSRANVGPLAEAFESAGLLDTAHRWLTRALRDLDPAAIHGDDEVAVELLHDRARVRRALALSSDAYDRASIRLRASGGS